MTVRERGLKDATDSTTSRTESPLTEMGQDTEGSGWFGGSAGVHQDHGFGRVISVYQKVHVE